jgi:hypothetical protein
MGALALTLKVVISIKIKNIADTEIIKIHPDLIKPFCTMCEKLIIVFPKPFISVPGQFDPIANRYAN